MKLNELTRSIPMWVSNEERSLFESVKSLRVLESFDERERVIIESLIRKNLLIKIESRDVIYVYPNV
jgi:hypothetical protein